MKPPAFQFYPSDFMMGTITMTTDEVGTYIRLLCIQWEIGGLPNDDSTLMRLAGCVSSTLAVVRQKFALGADGKLRNARMEDVRAKQDAFRAACAAAGRKGGGNPKLKSKVRPKVPLNQPLNVGINSPSPSPSPISESNPNPAEAAPPSQRRPRNLLLDALVSVDGSDPMQATSSAFKTAATALKDIRTAMPNVTAEEVFRRAGNYRRSHPTWTLSAMALAKHWSASANLNGALQHNDHGPAYREV
jgi:uncharacterized protein YdaU (DUF1376 family)